MEKIDVYPKGRYATQAFYTFGTVEIHVYIPKVGIMPKIAFWALIMGHLVDLYNRGFYLTQGGPWFLYMSFKSPNNKGWAVIELHGAAVSGLKDKIQLFIAEIDLIKKNEKEFQNLKNLERDEKHENPLKANNTYHYVDGQKFPEDTC